MTDKKPDGIMIEVKDKDGNFVPVKIREEYCRTFMTPEEAEEWEREFFEAMDEGYPI